jgi:hypothetical protein
MLHTGLNFREARDERQHRDRHSCGRLLLGRQELLRQRRGHLHPGRIHGRGERPPDLPAPSWSRGGGRDRLRPGAHLLPGHPRALLQIHNPTTKDRQGNDIGSAFRSEIFFTSDEQRQVAEDTIADVDASGLSPGKVVTEISEAVPFWVAEPEHQDNLQRYPDGYTCHFPRPGWKLPHRQTAA